MHPISAMDSRQVGLRGGDRFVSNGALLASSHGLHGKRGSAAGVGFAGGIFLGGGGVHAASSHLRTQYFILSAQHRPTSTLRT